ncbi:MAG: relaxase/mobilization nuclease domain-containing protein, partial [Hyphomicrobiaceae bacterium]|nr:relaxase/mobilization nuclease domain-containing protein [Hyphomicrobiaceae bacterium]
THRHMHMMINRVHPVTGKAWSTSHDFKRFDRIMRALADEYGFEHTPSHTFEPDLTDDKPKKPKKRAHYAAKRGANTKRLQWSRRDARTLAAKLSEHLDQSSTFDDIVAALEAEGLTVEAKGKGHVAGNRRSYVKLSALGLSAAAKDQAKLRASKRRPKSTTRKAQARSIFAVDEVDIARAIGTRTQYRTAIERAKALRKLRIGRLPVLAQLLDDLHEKLKGTTALNQTKARNSRYSHHVGLAKLAPSKGR